MFYKILSTAVRWTCFCCLAAFLTAVFPAADGFAENQAVVGQTVVGQAVEGQAVEGQTVLEVPDCPVSLRFNSWSGMISGMTFEGESICLPDQNAVQFDFQVNNDWIAFGSERSLEHFSRPDDRTLIVSQRVGSWRLESSFTLVTGQAMFKRSVRLTYLGTEPEVRIKAFWEAYPTLRADENAAMFMPGNYPPKLVRAVDLASDKHIGFGDNTAFVCQIRGDVPASDTAATDTAATDTAATDTAATARPDSPIVPDSPNPLTVMFLYNNNDPNADRSGYEVSRTATPTQTPTQTTTGLRVKQVFQIKARMKPGDSQELGTSWVWVLPLDRDAAMKRIHDWQAMVGMVVPADRPKWFESAVIYAFHPNGTIGSNMSDWGGFQAAETVLPRIRSMGINTLWILPLEDKSIYWPRDYYKFQDGLGTAEDYRRLVKTAHELDMNVLQDCVPHGGANYYPRAKEHPEWLAYKEDGSTFEYWCYDFNWPTWRQYMAGVVRHYMQQYDLDGYRVDAVGGSRTPNWAEQLPYSRASFSQSQGGVNMLRSLRESVKSVKPEKAGLLAEVQGSRYGAVADAVYDFTGCYSAFQAIRTQEPAQFVKTLRRWLYESQYGEVKGLLRLRHIESHDSLRSQGWYGIQAMRALFALTCFIDGIPLMYQEQEIGNLHAFNTIIQTRNQLPELQNGDADYTSVIAPDGVFACLRTKGNNRSIVLINFNYEPVKFQLDVAKFKPVDGCVTISGNTSESPISSDGTIGVELATYGYKVVTLRKTGNPETPHVRLQEPAVQATNDDSDYKPEDVLSISCGQLVFDISKKTGLIERLHMPAENDTVVMEGDLILPAEYVGNPDDVIVSTKMLNGENNDQRIIVRRQYPTGTMILTYRITSGDGRNISGDGRNGHSLVIDTEFEGARPEYAALTLGIDRADSWTAGHVSSEPLCDSFFPRPAAGRPGTSSIYWRVQGTNVLYDSMFQPLGYWSGLSINNLSNNLSNNNLSKEAVRRPLNVFFSDMTRIPPRVQLLGRTEHAEQLTACLWLIDNEVPVAKNDGRCSLSISNESWQGYDFTLKPVAGGYMFDNEYYRLRLGRGGAIIGLWSKDPATGAMKKIIDRGQMYTDYGWGDKGVRYSTEYDVEAAVRLNPADNSLQLVFQGQIRGMGRFEKTSRPIKYTVEYLLAEDSPSFGFRTAIDTLPGSVQETGFLAMFFPIPEMDSCVWLTKNPATGSTTGSTTGSATGSNTARQITCLNRETKGRCWQSASEQIIPCSGVFHSGDSILMTVSDIQASNVRNVFVDGQNLFFAFADSTPLNQVESGEFQATITVGNQPVASGNQLFPAKLNGTSSSKQASSILKNGDFEEMFSGRYSARYKLIQSTQPGTHPLNGWSVPGTGRSCSENPKSGRFCLEVENSTGEYILASQVLPISRMPAGSRWKLRGYVRAENVKIGDISWKVGCLRFCAIVNGQTVYISSPDYLGSFTWQPVEIDLTMPDNCTGITIQAGLNGATGKIWFDRITLEQVE